MSRFFALPVLATMLALVGIRMIGAPSSRAEKPLVNVVAPPLQEPAFAETSAGRPEVPPAPIVTAEEIGAPAPAPEPQPPTPRLESPVIVLEPLQPPAPVVRTEVIERTVYVPQQPTIVYAPTNIYYPPAEAAPAPPQEVVEVPVIVVVNAPQGRPLPPARRPKAQQDSFFKDIPFLPATPKGSRWSP
jgi:hypothetical protein